MFERIIRSISKHKTIQKKKSPREKKIKKSKNRLRQKIDYENLKAGKNFFFFLDFSVCKPNSPRLKELFGGF